MGEKIMDEAEKRLLFGSLATPEPQQVVPAQPAVQPQQPVVTQQTPQPRPPIVTQPTQQTQTPDVATLAQQAASAQQQLNATTPPTVAPSAVNSLGNNIGDANFWNAAGALGGILGTAALANQLFTRIGSSVNGQEQVTHGRVEPTMNQTQPQAPANTGFNEPTGQQISNPVESTTEEQLVNKRVEEVKAETKKPFAPATSPKATAQDVEMVVKSEANKQSKAQPVKPPSKVNERAHWPEGWTRGGMGWLVNQYDIDGAKAYIDEHNNGKPFLSHEEALKNVEKTQMRPIYNEIPKEVRKSRGIAPNPQYKTGSKPLMGNAIVPPEQQVSSHHGMVAPHSVVLNPMNVFEGINKAKED
jgi:hypothetical protein